MKNPNRDAARRRATETNAKGGSNPLDAIVVYCTGNGATMQYAEWISEELNCDVVPYSRKHLAYVSMYRNVIFGGWVRTGEINKLNMLRQNAANFNLESKNVVVFGVGIAPETEEYVEYLRHQNGISDNVEFHFLPGKFDPNKVSLTASTSLKALAGTMYNNMDAEFADEMKRRFEEGWDGVDKDRIKPITDSIIKKTLEA